MLRIIPHGPARWSLRVVSAPILPYLLSVLIFVHQADLSRETLNIDTLAFSVAAICTWMAYVLTRFEPTMGFDDSDRSDLVFRRWCWIFTGALSLVVFALSKVDQADDSQISSNAGLAIDFLFLWLSIAVIFVVFQHAQTYRLENQRGV